MFFETEGVYDGSRGSKAKVKFLFVINNIYIPRFKHITGDHLTLLTVYNMFKIKNNNQDWCRENYLNPRSLKSADDVRNQLESMLKKKGTIIKETKYKTEYSKKIIENISKAILSGFFSQVAHLEPQGHYLTVKDNQYVAIHPSSCLDYKPEWVVYNDFVLTNKNYIRTCMRVKAEYFIEIAGIRF